MVILFYVSSSNTATISIYLSTIYAFLVMICNTRKVLGVVTV